MAIVGFVLLAGGFFAFAFGATRLLLRGTFLEPYTAEASILAGPLYATLALSAFAYRVPDAVPFQPVLLLFLAGVLLSLAVGLCEWRRLAELARQNAGRLFLLLPPACFAAWVMMAYFPGNEWRLFSVHPHNTEYLNYAEMSALLTGRYQVGPDAPLDAFPAAHRQIRYGQDLIIASVAQLAGQPPINVLLPLSVFFRFQGSVALGLLLYLAAPPRQRRWLVPALLLFDGYHLAQVFTFSASFLSSNCTVPLFLVYLLVAFCCDRFDGRVVGALVLVNLYGLITYPEFLAVVKCFELAVLVEAVIRRRFGRAAILLVANLAVCLSHPALVLKQVALARRLSDATVGYNPFGHPLREPLLYLSNCLGLRCAGVRAAPLAPWPWLTPAVIAVVLPLAGLGLIAFARRHRAWSVVFAWSAFACYFHARPADGEVYYGAVKFLTQTYALVFAALVPLFAVHFRPLRCLAGLALVGWAAAAGLASVRSFTAVHAEMAVYDYGALREALGRAAPDARDVACLVDQPGALWVLELAARDCGVPLKPLSPEQAAVLRRAPAGPSSESQLVYDGLVLVDGAVLHGAAPAMPEAVLRFEPRYICAQLRDLYLCRGRILHASTWIGPRWITAESPVLPRLYVAQDRIVLQGEILPAAGLPMPYHFKLSAPEIGVEWTVTIPAAGTFETVLELPAGAAGHVISPVLSDFATFNIRRIVPDSVDPRRFGFVLSVVRCQSGQTVSSSSPTTDH